MAFKFITAGATGSYQTILSRLIEDPETIDLTDTPGALSVRAIPFDGIDDIVHLDSIIYTTDIGSSGDVAEVVMFDAWVKPNVTGQTFNTFFESSIIRSMCATTSGYDGIYAGHIVSTGGGYYVDFRVDHDTTYSLTSASQIVTTTWTHILCSYLSGSQQMQIWINGAQDATGDMNSVTSLATGAALGARTIAFGGILDELRMWIASAAASSITALAQVSNIGKAPEEMSLLDLTPSGNSMLGWWRLDSTSSYQLFGAVENSIEDYTVNSQHGRPWNFLGSDMFSNELTLISGLSASGDLQNLLGGSLDHGGLSVLDPWDGTIRLEIGSQNLVTDPAWIVSGSDVLVGNETHNIFYGSSAVVVNTASAETGIFHTLSSTDSYYADNPYLLSFRIRSLSGSSSARVTYIVGTSVSTITASFGVTTWDDINIANIMKGTTATGRVDIMQLEDGTSAGALFIVDGVQIVEAEHPSAFVGPARTRKSGQAYWPILD